MGEKTGVLLINVGTPAAPTVRATRAFLRAFLSDPHVIDLPGPLRWALVNLIIAPFRSRRSAQAYRRIWTEAGSPLQVVSEGLREGLAVRKLPR